MNDYYYNNEKRIVIYNNHVPLNTILYKKDEMHEARFNYIVFSDNVNGASVICDRNLYLKYIKEMINQIVYCEDLVYYLFMFDNICPYYFDYATISYECDSGNSNSKNDI